MRKKIVIAALVCFFVPLLGWSAFCEDCYQGPSHFGAFYSDGMCCRTGSDCSYIDPDWDQVISSSSYCRVDWAPGWGYLCQGQSGSCSSGGGGTGSGGSGTTCTIGFNQSCPAECFSCERQPFLN